MRVKNESERAGHVCNIGNLPMSHADILPTFIRNECDSTGRTDRKSYLTSKCPAKILKAIESFFDYVDAGGVAQTNGAIVAKGGARNDRDIRFTQEAVGKVL